MPDIFEPSSILDDRIVVDVDDLRLGVDPLHDPADGAGGRKARR
jgi:hypothetical protein